MWLVMFRQLAGSTVSSLALRNYLTDANDYIPSFYFDFLSRWSDKKIIQSPELKNGKKRYKIILERYRIFQTQDLLFTTINPPTATQKIDYRWILRHC